MGESTEMSCPSLKGDTFFVCIFLRRKKVCDLKMQWLDMGDLLEQFFWVVQIFTQTKVILVWNIHISHVLGFVIHGCQQLIKKLGITFQLKVCYFSCFPQTVRRLQNNFSGSVVKIEKRDWYMLPIASVDKLVMWSQHFSLLGRSCKKIATISFPI